MGKSGYIQYKCRRCGAVFNGTHGPDIQDMVIRLMVDGDYSVPCALISMNKTHSCETDMPGLGIADCIGAEYDPSETDSEKG